MIKAICIYLLALMALVACEPPSTHYGTPISSYGTPNYNTNHNNHEYSAPKSYEFGYQVKDDYTGNNYKRQEASDGNQVNGEYRVQLPDGRTQIVTYYADWQTGFHADVRYEGTANYPETYGNGGFGGPSSNYGPPAFNNGPHHGPVSNQYGGPGFGGAQAPATSSVSIKDYSGPGTPYHADSNGYGYGNGNGNGNGNNYNGGYNLGNGYQNGGYDSYANAGAFGSKIRPSAAYGAP